MSHDFAHFISHLSIVHNSHADGATGRIFAHFISHCLSFHNPQFPMQMAPLVRRDEMLLSWDGSQWLPRATIQENQDLNQIFASKLEFSDRFNKMQLLQSEQALFCAVLLCFSKSLNFFILVKIYICRCNGRCKCRSRCRLKKEVRKN